MVKLISIQNLLQFSMIDDLVCITIENIFHRGMNISFKIILQFKKFSVKILFCLSLCQQRFYSWNVSP